jgi:Phosphodiester glycosidase
VVSGVIASFCMTLLACCLAALRARRAFVAFVVLMCLVPVGVASALATHAGGVVGVRSGGGVQWRPASYRVDGVYAIRSAMIRTGSGAVAYAALVDHTRTRLALYPGLSDPPSARPRGLGEVPYGQRWRLLATFNSGFQAAAGAGGVLINGHANIPLRRGLGTVVVYWSGQVDIVSWDGPPASRAIVLARQNLPLIVDAGRPNRRLSDGPAWGATLHSATSVWRSAIGINRNGDLLYAAADGQTAPSLARLMVRLGAIRAIELDINPEWPSFNSYLRRGGRDPIKLLPNPQQGPNRWLSPDSREFFAIYTRKGGSPAVPFR